MRFTWCCSLLRHWWLDNWTPKFSTSCEINLSIGTGPEKKAKIFLQDYHRDFYNLYVTFYSGSEFRTLVPVSCTGFEKTGIFAGKIDFSQFKKKGTKRHIYKFSTSLLKKTL